MQYMEKTIQSRMNGQMSNIAIRCLNCRFPRRLAVREDEKTDILFRGDGSELCKEVHNASQLVWDEIGTGYMEKNYRDILAIELRSRNIPCDTERPIPLMYKGFHYGQGFVDVYIPDRLVIEIKAEKTLNVSQSIKQCKKYMSALNVKVGLIVNFPSKREYIAEDSLEFIKIDFLDFYQE